MAHRREGGTGVVYVTPDPDAETIQALEAAEFRVEHITDPAGVDEHLGTTACVVSHQQLSQGTGLELLEGVREAAPDLPFVLVADDGDECLASRAITAGVSEYVPERPARQRARVVVSCVERAIEGRVADTGVEEALKDRAMDDAPVGITIAEASEDLPLVYVNEAFEEITGFDRENVLGRNCRFLQGPDTDPEAVDRMHQAVDEGSTVSVEVLNYTTDGEPFWNRIDIAPIHQNGELTHFVGYQADVSDRVEAEQRAREEAARARRERETVELLLAQLEGLVTDITSMLVQTRTRAAVESQVCRRLVAEEAYDLACVVDVAPGTEDLVPTTCAGDETLVSTFSRGEGPVAAAYDGGSPQFMSAPEGGWPALEADLRHRPLAAVPLSYGDATYGVLVLVGAEGNIDAGSASDSPYPDGASTIDGFDEHERSVILAIGRAMATALNAVASQRQLHSDEVVELEFSLEGPDPFVVALSGDLDCIFDHVGTVPGGDRTALFFEVTGTTRETLADAVESLTDVVCRPLTSSEDRLVVEFEVGRIPLVRTLLEQGGRLQSLRAEGGTGRLIVEIDPSAEPRRIVDAVESGVEGADLSAFRERERPERTWGEVLDELDERLTDRQATALRKAYVGGFFEWPRDTTGEDLAQSMEIDRSTFHQHFRAAQRKLLETIYSD